jgi:hypothetical protein
MRERMWRKALTTLLVAAVIMSESLAAVLPNQFTLDALSPRVLATMKGINLASSRETRSDLQLDRILLESKCQKAALFTCDP